MQQYVYRKPDNLVELFETAVELFPYNKLFGIKNPDKKSLAWMTYKQVGDRVDNLRAGLAAIGINKGDAVGIISNNRPEWAIAAFAAYGRGARFVPMYEAELVKIWKYIVSDSRRKVLFVSKKSIYERSRTFPIRSRRLEKIILIEGEGPGTMKELEAIGSKNPVPSIHSQARMTLRSLIYTSGTTGDPKGVLLSHGNLTHCARSGYHIYPELTAGCAQPVDPALGALLRPDRRALQLVPARRLDRLHGERGDPRGGPGTGQADVPDRRAPHLQQDLRRDLGQDERGGRPAAASCS